MPQQTFPTNQEDREVYLGEHDYEMFMKAVKHIEDDGDTLVTMLDDFRSDPELLYVALNYARDKRVTVTIFPAGRGFATAPPTAIMLPNNQEDCEVFLREHDAGDFIEAVNSTQTKQADTLIMMLDAFWGEPELLYVALNYARDQGVTVTMTPPSDSP